jgi:hypothetical protein
MSTGKLTGKRGGRPSLSDSAPQVATEDGHYRVYWPRTRRQVAIKPLAKRPASLQGKTIGLLWDYVFRGDEVFGILEKEMKARYPGLRFINWREFGNTHGSDEHQVIKALPSRMKELKVDAVISGMGC